jgi:hypothetical protein
MFLKRKLVKDAVQDGKQYRWDNPEIDCSEPSPHGGWTEAIINAIGSEQFCEDYNIPYSRENGPDEDVWDEALELWEKHAQLGWENAYDEA